MVGTDVRESITIKPAAFGLHNPDKTTCICQLIIYHIKKALPLYLSLDLQLQGVRS